MQELIADSNDVTKHEVWARRFLTAVTSVAIAVSVLVAYSASSTDLDESANSPTTGLTPRPAPGSPGVELPSPTVATTPAATRPLSTIANLSEGSTRIRVGSQIKKSLTRRDIRLRPLGDARRSKGDDLVLAVTGGNVTVFDAAMVQPAIVGQVHHSTSGLVFSRDRTRLELNNLNFDPTMGHVYADSEAGDSLGKNLRVFRLSNPHALAAQPSPGVLWFTGGTLLFTGVGAQMLNAAFGRPVTSAGDFLGTLSLKLDVTGERPPR